MNHTQASAIGDIGERRVGDVLRSEAPALGFRLIDNLLLVDDLTTAQLDHVLVDRFGILVVETKEYRALIKGTSDDRFWTARYSGSGRRRDRFLNPLRQNDRHREMIHCILGASGRNLPPGYVQSLVAFAGGNLERLKVSEVDSMRVVPDREIVDYLRARCGDFQPNPGALDAEQVADLISLLESVNQAGNPDVIALHAENIGRATRRFGDWLHGNRPASSSAPSMSPYGAPTIYHAGARYPDVSNHAPLRADSRRDRLMRQLLAALVLCVMAWWLLLGGGVVLIGTVSTYLASAVVGGLGTLTPAVTAPVPAPATQQVGYDVPLALRRLQEVDPTTYAKLSNASSPGLSVTRGLPTYTWQYVDQVAQGAATISSIAVTLDGNGRIVGVTNGS